MNMQSYFSDSSKGTIVSVFPIDTSSFKIVDNWGSVFPLSILAITDCFTPAISSNSLCDI